MTTSRPSFAVIGDPVEHSLSPRLFSRLFADLQIDAHYTALRVTPRELPEVMEAMRRGALAGLSVTIPHKEAIVPLLDALHPSAARIGAVNCVMRTQTGVVQGYNTDAPGFRMALEHAGTRLAAARLVLLGSGGAARAAAFAAVMAGAKSVSIAGRDPERAMKLGLDLVGSGRAWPEGELLRRWEDAEGSPRTEGPPMVRRLASPSGKCFVNVVALSESAISHPLLHADVLVNATSVGMGNVEADPLPVGNTVQSALTLLDMVYSPLETALLRRGRASGATVVDGLWMLVYQALEQLRIWTGRSAPPALAQELHDRLAREMS